MKKLVMTAAVLACAASIVSAQTVTSANIVGYAKETLSAGQFQIVSPQFLQGGGSDMVLSNAFSSVSDQSVVYTWNGSAYTEITYYDGFGWFDAIFTPFDGLVVGSGDAMWLKDGGAGSTPIMSGEVPMVASVTNSLVAGFNLVANPYPTAIVLDDIPVASLSDLDVVYLWSGSSYLEATYYAGFGWFDAIFTPLGTTPVAVGQGFWLSSAAGGDLVFDKQY